MKNYKKTIIITTLVTLLPILLGVILWEKLPDSIATHWGADGQASAGQLTPRFLPLSLSIRLLQVTAAISPSAAKGASKGRFSARIRSEDPRRQMQDFKRWVKGELLWRNRKIY